MAKHCGRARWQPSTRDASLGRSLAIERLEDRVLLSADLITKRLELFINDLGQVSNVYQCNNGVRTGSSLRTGNLDYFAKLTIGGTTVNPTSFSYDSGASNLTFQFPSSRSLTVHVDQGTSRDYFTFTVNTLSPLTDGLALKLGNFSTTLTSHINAFSGFAANNSFAMYVRSLGPAGWVDTQGASASSNLFCDTIAPYNHIVYDASTNDTRLALGGCDYGVDGSGVRTALDTLIDNEGLLTSTVVGPSAMDASINQQSYMFAYLGENDVQDWIALAKKEGIGILLIAGWKVTYGHNQLSPEKFPNGLDGMRSVVNQIHDAGLQAGLQCYTVAIDPTDAYVNNPTHIPDSRLGKDATLFKLTSDLSRSATTLQATWNGANPPPVSTLRGGNVIQIDNELITYSSVSLNGSTYTFSDCSRRQYGTLAPSYHYANTIFSHLPLVTGYFSPDPDSSLLDEIGDGLVAIINCGSDAAHSFDMAYLDATEVGASLYALNKQQASLFAKINHPMRIEMAINTPYAWTFCSVSGAFDFPHYGDETYVDWRCTYLDNAPDSDLATLLPAQLGWWGFRGSNSGSSSDGYNGWDSLSPKEMEYFCAKMIGFGVTAPFIPATPLDNPTSGRQDEFVTMIAKWQSIASTIDSATKQRLQTAGDDFHLTTTANGDVQLSQMAYDKHTADSRTAGSSNLTVANPYSAQDPTMRIEALYGVGDFASGTQTITGTSGADMPSTIDTASSSITAAMAWQNCPTGGPNQAQSMYFSATNNGSSSYGAWAKATKGMSLDMGANGAIGLWIYGDGRGEMLNFELLDTSYTHSDHYVTVDFNGWKYFEFPLRERDIGACAEYGYGSKWPYAFNGSTYSNVLDTHNIMGLYVYYNDLPADGTASGCYISAVKSLPVSPITIHNPSVRIGDQTITFGTTSSPVDLQSGQYIEFASATDCRLYDQNGVLLGDVATSGTLGQLASGSNTVVFNTSTGYYRADVTIASGNTVGTFHAAPVILTTPVDQAVDSLETANFLVYAVGTSLNYQWQYRIDGAGDWINITSDYTGYTDACLTTPTVNSGYDGYQYRVAISNSYGSAISNIVTLRVNYVLETEWRFDETSGTIASETSGLSPALDGAWYGSSSGGYIAPQWTTGAINNAIELDGADDYIQVSDDDRLDSTSQLTISTWVYPVSLGNSAYGLISKRNTADDNESYCLFFGPDHKLVVDIDGAGNRFCSNTVFSTGQWYHIAVTYDGSLPSIERVKLYVNGVLDTTAGETGASIPNYTSSLLIGCTHVSGGIPQFCLNARIDDTRIYNHALSPTAIAEQARRPVAYLKLDETTGTTAYDVAQNGYASGAFGYRGTGYNGVLTNVPASPWTTGMIDGALAFDGQDDYVSVPFKDSADTALEYNGGTMTLSAWVYVNATETTGGYLISRPWNTATSPSEYNYQLYLNASATNSCTVGFTLQGGLSGAATITTPTGISKGAWHSIAVTVDSTTGSGNPMRLCVDGKLEVCGTHAISTWAPTIDSNLPLAIGSLYPYSVNTAYAFDGNIDQIRVYSTVLGATEIRKLHQTERDNVAPNASMSMNNVAFVAPNATTGVTLIAAASDTDGIISNVAFYEGTTFIANGTLSNGSYVATWNVPAWSYGGHVITAVATDNDGDTATTEDFDLTICGWPTNQAVDVGQTATFTVASPVGSVALASYQWQKYNTSTSTWGNIVGATGPYYTTAAAVQADNGALYRVVVSNGGAQATSPSAPLYVNYGLEAWWKLDESSGVIVADASGKGHTGTRTNGGAWGSTSGLINGALTLDGTDSYVSVPAPSGSTLKYTGAELTLGAWVNVNSTETDGGYLISRPWNTSGGQYNYRLGINSARQVTFDLQGTSTSYTITSSAALPTGEWHHVAATVNASKVMTIYIDGVAVASGTHTITAWAPTDSNKPLVIGSMYNYSTGSYSAYSFKGRLDNVRVYDQTLTLDEVKTLAIDPTMPAGSAALRSTVARPSFRAATRKPASGKLPTYASLAGDTCEWSTSIVADALSCVQRADNDVSTRVVCVDTVLRDEYAPLSRRVLTSTLPSVGAVFPTIGVGRSKLFSDDNEHGEIESVLDDISLRSQGLTDVNVLSAVDTLFSLKC